MGEIAEILETETKLHEVKKNAFLSAYSQCGNITQAAEAAGINRKAHYNWMRDCPEYPAFFQQAHEAATDKLEQEARHRALGYEEDIVYQGQVTGKRKVCSDNLLMFMLKGERPDKFRDNTTVEVKDSRQQLPADDRERRIQELLRSRMGELDVTPLQDDDEPF